MPGFTLIYQQGGLTDSVKTRAVRLVESAFKIEFISKTDVLLVLFKDGNQYPYEIFDTDQYIAIIEGRIYSIDIFKNKEFGKALDSIFYQADDLDSSLKFIRRLDGEFVIYLLDKKGEKYFVINDFLGRLPVYISEDRQLIITRDIYVLDKVSTGLLFDEESVYQYLRLGYPLGERTLFQDVRRLPAASFLSVINGKIQNLKYAIDLSEIEGTFTDSKPEESLYELFRTALKNRLAKERKVVLSTSGGLDSRLIMAEVVKNKYAIDFATFQYENEIIKNDVTIVKQLARLYQKSPQFFDLKEWNPELIEEMVVLKGGMNYVGMSFILDFLKQLGSNYNLMLTGDGGDKTLPQLLPLIALENKKLTKYILKTNGVSAIRHIDSNVTFEVGKYERALRVYLSELPGENAGMKFKHFLIYNRACNWLFEGEDRNRNYLWSTTPFYNPEFFQMAHSVPEKVKRNFELFRKFTALIDPQLNKIANANWGIELGDAKKVNNILRRQKLKNRLPFRFYQKEQNFDFHEELAQFVFELMHKGYGGQILLNADRYDLVGSGTEQLFHLLTLLKVSEMTWKSI